MTLKIYMDTVRWFCRPKNTDWQYNFMLQGLSRYEMDLELYYPVDNIHQFRVNLDYCRAAIGHRIRRLAGVPYQQSLATYTDRLSAQELRRAGCDVVFSHREFPVNTGDVPVVWQNSVLDPLMSAARGVARADLQAEFNLKRQLFSKAARVQVSTHAEAERLSTCMPELKERFVAVPFFLPYLESEEESAVARKHADAAPLHFVFVGREAHRKGLLETLAALDHLEFGKRHDVRLTIISDFRDGPVALPNWNNLVWERSVPREKVFALLNNAHVLLMPSRFESYGFVYLEAMSRGTVPVVPDWEVQRELVNAGSCGVIVRVEPNAIATGIESLIRDRELRSELAVNSVRRVREQYAPEVVAKGYRKLFRDACLQRGRSNVVA
jgi:glycosyltransferase involved in cell wall biosynthesis